MSVAAIRTALKTVIEGVSGLGQVHDYLRWSISRKTLKSLFKADSAKFHVWLITRTAVKDDWLSQNQNGIRTHSFVILGFYGLKDSDATEKTFQDLIDLVVTALRNASKQPAPLSGAALRMSVPAAEPIDHKDYVDVLSHAVRIAFTVDEYIPPA